MAEARNAIDLYYLQKRGVDIGPDLDGYYTFQLRIPSFNVLVSQSSLYWHRLKYSIYNRLWPISPLGLLTVMGAVSAGVVNANESSWVRTGWLADALWRVDSTMGLLNPVFRHYPVSFRVGYLASITAFVGMLGIAAVEQLSLRLILSWQGWLFGPKSTLGKICLNLWGSSVKLLTGRKNMTYAFDNCLPILPLPSLASTCKHYLESVKPLMTEEEFKRTEEQALQFQKNEGKKFQRYLWFKHLFSSNYILEWWEKYCYLYGRTPIAINSNYYVLDAKERPTLDQCQRAAGIAHHFLRFKDMIESENLDPMVIRGLIPLCMSQYRRMFGTCRIPGRDCDRLVHTQSRHVVVVSGGIYYKLDVYHGAKGTRLRPYTADEIEAQLILIVEHSKRNKNLLPTTKPDAHRNRHGVLSARVQSFEDLVIFESFRGKAAERKRGNSPSHLVQSASIANFTRSSLYGKPTVGTKDEAKLLRRGGNIAAFTAGPRGRWAEVRDMYFSEGVNRKSLDAIESAAFIICLEDTQFTNLNDRAHSLFHGSGKNRWFDKTINLMVYQDGYVGLNCEHSWADAPIIAHLWEFSLLSELMDFQKKTPKKAPNFSHSDPSDKMTELPTPSFISDTSGTKKVESKLPVPKQLLWDVDDELQAAIDAAYAFASTLISDLDLCVTEHSSYGKGFMKQNGVSPDGYIQMALQLAYFRNMGNFDLTYESSMTRLFRGGRTETTRSLCKDSVAFVRSMEDEKASTEDKIKALRVACDAHSNKNKLMMAGKGIDRHLFALYITSKGFDQSSEFINSALSMPWRLSTSQQPQYQTTMRKLLPFDVSERFVSPGGGFGPVADDGYGVSYMCAGEKRLFFHVSSKYSVESTSSSKFTENLLSALEDMQNLFKKED